MKIVALNLALATFGSLAAFGSFNKMQLSIVRDGWRFRIEGKTRPCIVLAMGLIALGLVGQWLGLAREEWPQYADTALYGGILALIIGSQREHVWFLERWANPASIAIALFSGAVYMWGIFF